MNELRSPAEIADMLDSTNRLIEFCRRDRERYAQRCGAAIKLATSMTVAKALLGGRHVPREALHPDFRGRLVCWDGYLTDDIALDVEVLLEADRAAGDVEATTWKPRL